MAVRSLVLPTRLRALCRCPFCAFRTLYRLEDFPPMNRDFLWRFKAKSYFVSLDIHDGNDDVVVDDDALVFLAGQDKHGNVIRYGPTGIKSPVELESVRGLRKNSLN